MTCLPEESLLTSIPVERSVNSKLSCMIVSSGCELPMSSMTLTRSTWGLDNENLRLLRIATANDSFVFLLWYMTEVS
jgi:hypothetical protein